MDRGPCWPPLSVCIRRLIAKKKLVAYNMVCKIIVGIPLEETPAPISMSGSSTTSPLSMGLPPVPPYSAVNSHFRSASVRRSIGIILIPV